MHDILKALAHPVRMDILQWLKTPEQFFGEQARPFSDGVCARQFERCGLSQSTVSAHLTILLRANLLTSTKFGQWVFYKRNEDTICSFLQDMQNSL
ncbi:ArsR/SmtB family transcription factor [Agrobacterium sp. ES01]|uniref:ArsR/SmtB family transcription factor n=1 Tax=Agrobacterium sp. ES01 TaxID=3420714 RepID=UPI003D0D8B9D